MFARPYNRRIYPAEYAAGDKSPWALPGENLASQPHCFSYPAAPDVSQ